MIKKAQVLWTLPQREPNINIIITSRRKNI